MDAPAPLADATPATHPPGIGGKEFVALMAALMSLPALSTDPMLPALPEIGRDLAVLHDNDRQQVIAVFFLGLAFGAMLFGPLSDRFGRRPVLLGASGAMLASTLLCAVAPTFEILVLARLAAGFCAAACRVVVVGVVRDCYRGDAMARTMSLIFMIFIVVPVLAPSFGQLIIAFAPWRGIFWALAVILILVMGWALARLPETLKEQNRVGVGLRDVGSTFATILRNRSSIGYMLASGTVMGSFIGFLISSQQIFFDVFHVPDLFPFAFAGIAMWIGVGAFFNSRLVERFGARRSSQTAMILIIIVSLAHALFVMAGHETLLSFIVSQSILGLFFSFAGANFSAISLEPFSRGAGLASSIQTTLTTLLSVGLGGFVGSRFDGTTLPVTLGFFVYGTVALLIILWAEGGRLFTRPNLNKLRGETKTAMPGS